MTSKIAKLLENARACERFARTASTPIGQETFIQLAVAWRMLALHEFATAVAGPGSSRARRAFPLRPNPVALLEGLENGHLLLPPPAVSRGSLVAAE